MRHYFLPPGCNMSVYAAEEVEFPPCYAMHSLLLLLAVTGAAVGAGDPTPIVLWHGMGDSCCNPLSMGGVKKLMEKHIPGVYVKSLMIGSNVADDTANGFFMDVQEQLKMVCAQLSNDTALQNGYHAIGFSQGGQFLRGIAQKCPTPRMKRLISVGGQHQGVYGLPHCPGPWWICQELCFRFIAEINQEGTEKPEYKENLLKLSNFTLIKFTKDSMVTPRESEWFGFYLPGSDKNLYTLVESDPLWNQDKLGLRELWESGRLEFLEIEGDHLQVPEKFWLEEIIPRLKD
eukprot:sb/3467679/